MMLERYLIIQWDSQDINYIHICQLIKKMLVDIYILQKINKLCKLNQHSITEEALTYAYDNMNKGERIKYSIFFTDFKFKIYYVYTIGFKNP